MTAITMRIITGSGTVSTPSCSKDIGDVPSSCKALSMSEYSTSMLLYPGFHEDGYGVFRTATIMISQSAM